MNCLVDQRNAAQNQVVSVQSTLVMALEKIKEKEAMINELNMKLEKLTPKKPANKGK